MKNMRKFISVLLAAVVLCACVAAAEAVPSPVKPAAVVSQVVTANEVKLEVPFVVETVETENWSEKAVAEFEEITQVLEEIAQALEAPAQDAEAPASVVTAIFTEEEIATVTELLPEEYDVAELAVAEFISLNIKNYIPEIGDAAVQVALPGEYTVEDVLVAMFKPFEVDESGWIALEAKVVADAEEADAAETDAEAEVTSNVEVLFTQEVLEMMAAEEGALLILRGSND